MRHVTSTLTATDNVARVIATVQYHFLVAMWRAKEAESRRVKRCWEIIADNLSKAGFSCGSVSAIDSNGRTVWPAAVSKFDSNRSHGRAFVISRTRFRFPKYCSDTGVTSENYGNPTLKSGERLNFSLPYGSFEPFTGPATL